MVKLCETSAAALKVPLPLWEAVMVQEPAPVICAVPGDRLVTVQLPLALKLTAKPDVAVGETTKSASPKVLGDSVPNAIV